MKGAPENPMVSLRLLVVIPAMLIATASARAIPPDPAALAAVIDQRLAVRWNADKIKPAPLADDAEFLRRAYLDITGRIPRPADIHAFLADRSPDKRSRLIDRLLVDPRYAIHFANIWRAELLPEISSNAGAATFQVGFEAWLRERLRANVPYDRMVRELLTAPIAAEGKEAEPVLRDPARPNPLAFFAVKEARPENLTAAVARSFLGIRLECAQCHDHPFAKWKQDQFWAQAAFFAGVQRQGNGLFAPLTESLSRREAIMPESKKVQPARFLDGGLPAWQKQTNSRVLLAGWITAPDNAFFARAAVNRVWGQLFGKGLIDPVDDLRDDNPPSDRELLDHLSHAFVESKFDMRFLIRAIGRTEAYQRTSAHTDASQDDTPLPARMTVKALTGEQFFDSLALATGYRDDQDKGAARRQFLTRFALTGSIGEPETSVQQALNLANGSFVAWATDPERCPTLLAICGTPGITTKDRIEALYLTTLSRKPNAYEHERLARFVGNGTRPEPERLADVFWMLLNSAEFRLNH
jgi:hypothetical protein